MKTVKEIQIITAKAREAAELLEKEAFENEMKVILEKIDADILAAAQEGRYYCYYEYELDNDRKIGVQEHYKRVKAELEALGWTMEETQEFSCRATDPDDAHDQWSEYMKGSTGFWKYEIVQVKSAGKRSQPE